MELEPAFDFVTGEIIEGPAYIASDGYVYGAATLRDLGKHGARSPVTRELLRPIAYALQAGGEPLRVYDPHVFPCATLHLSLSVDALADDHAALFMSLLLEKAGAPSGACTLAFAMDGASVVAAPLAAGDAHSARCAALCDALRIAHFAPANSRDIASGCRVMEAGCSLEEAVLRAPVEDGALSCLVASRSVRSGTRT